jgi:hypothetical protein
MQNANALYQGTQFMGRFSFGPTVSVHVISGSLVSIVSESKRKFQIGFQPLPGIRGCAPDPAAGGFDDVAILAATKAR